MKKPVVLLIVLGALVAFALLYDKSLSKRINSARLVGVEQREFLLPNLPADKVRKIRIREADKQLNLTVSGDRWAVAERSGYTASFDKITRSVQTLAEMKIKGKDVIGKSILAEAKLLAPEEGAADRTGLQIELLDEKDGTIASFVAGGTVESSGGASSGNFMGGAGSLRYVRTPNDKDTVWLVEDSFYDLKPDPKDWVDKAFVDVRKIKSVEITQPNAPDSWKAERKDENNPFALGEPKNGDELDTAKADALSSVLSSATFADVLPKDNATPDFMKGAIKAKLVTFEGFTYNAELIEKKEGGADAQPKFFITVKIAADIAKERKADAAEKPEDKKKNDDDFAATKKSLEEKLAKEKLVEGWVYEISDYAVTALNKKRAEVLREKTPPAAPDPGATTPGVPSVPGIPAIPGLGGAPMPAPAAPPVPPRAPISVTTPPVSVDTAKPAPASAPAPAAVPAPAAPAAPVTPPPAKPADSKPPQP